MENSQGKLVLIGAGPGDPELISLKGIKALKKAEVILYDALVSVDLLAYASPECKRIFVGKRKGKKEFSQDEINTLLVFYTHRYKNVVRLKGGDPFVFGRGHEEVSFASKHKVVTEVIPGISSAIAAPGAANIPLTKRGVNESFWVITGTLSSGKISGDIQHAAKSSATVVILMGFGHLKKIAGIFAKARSSSEPVAVIQEATLSSQRVVTGTTSDIFEKVIHHGFYSPAVIVIGKVVNERITLEKEVIGIRSRKFLSFTE